MNELHEKCKVKKQFHFNNNKFKTKNLFREKLKKKI
jgi:hypothetical protein